MEKIKSSWNKLKDLAFGSEGKLEDVLENDDVKAVKRSFKGDKISEENKRMLLNRACAKGSVQIVEYLLEEAQVPADQDDEKTVKTGLTNLIEMIEKNVSRGKKGSLSWEKTAKVVDLLLKNGANPNTKMNGKAPLWSVCRRVYKESELSGGFLAPNAKDLVASLLKYGAEVDIVCRENTPLRQLIEHGVPEEEPAEIAEMLLEKGANPNVTQLLHIACSRNHNRIAKALIDHNAEINTVNPKGETPLMLACAHCDPETIIHLLEKGADATAMDSDENQPINFLSCHHDPKGLENVLEKFKEKGVDFNYESSVPFKSKTCLLTKATSVGEKGLEIVKMIVEKYGANPSGGSNCKKPPILDAGRTANVEVVSFLLEKGANPKATIHNLGYGAGMTAVVAAIKSSKGLEQRKEVVRILIKHGVEETEEVKEFLAKQATDKKEEDDKKEEEKKDEDKEHSDKKETEVEDKKENEKEHSDEILSEED